MAIVSACALAVVRLIIYFCAWELDVLELIAVGLGSALLLLSVIALIFCKEKVSRNISLAVNITCAVVNLVYALLPSFFDVRDGFHEKPFNPYLFVVGFIPCLIGVVFACLHLVANRMSEKRICIGNNEVVENGKCGEERANSLSGASNAYKQTDENKSVKAENVCGVYPLMKHTVLSVLLFFWKYVWIYRITNFLNGVEGFEKRNPVKKLLLCLFVPFYKTYWNYQSARRIDAYAERRGMKSELCVTCTVLGIFIGVLASVLMQQKINETESAKLVTANMCNAVHSSDAVEEIKRYKELLDIGAITSAEYDKIKKKLLE